LTPEPVLFISAALALWLGALIYRRAAAPGAATFIWLMSAIALWCLTSAFHGLAPTLDEKILWAKVQYVGICAVPPLWFLFLAQYVGSPWADDRRLHVALATIAGVTIILAYTNETHHLVWSSVQLSPAGAAIYNHGPWFWLAAAYHYLLMLGGMVVLVGALRRTPAVFKGQIVALITASLIPWTFNILYVLGAGPAGNFDATPLSFAFSGALFTWALYRTYLFDLIPIARDMLVDSLSDAVLVVDPTCRVLDMNAAARNLAAHHDNWIGKPCAQILPFLADVTLPLTSAPASIVVNVPGSGIGDSGSVDSRTPNPESPSTSPGTSRSYDVRTMPVRAKSQTFAAWVVLMRDVTDQRRAMEEHAALEARVQEQQKRESLSVLAGGLAHDFNNLLAGIVGNADLLALQIPPSSGMGGHIGAIILGAQRAADLVAKMLAYAGERHGTTERIDLNALTSELLELLRASAARHCTLQYHGESAVILGDPTQIRQVAMNLIINAAEAVEEHSGTVTVSTGIEQLSVWKLGDMTFGGDAEPGLYAFLEVRDNGSGMNAQTLEKIFNPFFTTKQSGHGLGLAAVQGIVRGHRGALRVESDVDRGSTFRVWLPA
jgi:signal transduction histidine kinase